MLENSPNPSIPTGQTEEPRPSGYKLLPLVKDELELLTKMQAGRFNQGEKRGKAVKYLQQESWKGRLPHTKSLIEQLNEIDESCVKTAVFYELQELHDLMSSAKKAAENCRDIFNPDSAADKETYVGFQGIIDCLTATLGSLDKKIESIVQKSTWNSVTYYYWENAGYYGHAAIQVCVPHKKPLYFSLGADYERPVAGGFEACSNSKNSDITAYRKANKIKLPQNGLVDTEKAYHYLALAKIEEQKANVKYNIVTHNCSTLATETLKKALAKVPVDYRPNFGISTPYQGFQYARKAQAAIEERRDQVAIDEKTNAEKMVELLGYCMVPTTSTSNGLLLTIRSNIETIRHIAHHENKVNEYLEQLLSDGALNLGARVNQILNNPTNPSVFTARVKQIWNDLQHVTEGSENSTINHQSAATGQSPNPNFTKLTNLKTALPPKSGLNSHRYNLEILIGQVEENLRSADLRQKVFLLKRQYREVYCEFNAMGEKNSLHCYYKELLTILREEIGTITNKIYFSQSATAPNILLQSMKNILQIKSEPGLNNENIAEVIAHVKSADFWGKPAVQTSASLPGPNSIHSIWGNAQRNASSIGANIPVLSSKNRDSWRKSKEITAKNQIFTILKNAELNPLDKIIQIQSWVEKNIPSNFTSKTEHLKYREIQAQASLICLIDAFVNGYIDEPNLLNKLMELTKHFPSAQKELLEKLINQLQGKYRLLIRNNPAHEAYITDQMSEVWKTLAGSKAIYHGGKLSKLAKIIDPLYGNDRALIHPKDSQITAISSVDDIREFTALANR